MRAVNPKKWGPSAWALLHLISFNKNISLCKARAFILALREVLPCPACRNHFEEHVKEMPFPRRASRLGIWMYDLHERVNASLGKSSGLTFKNVRMHWQDKAINGDNFKALDLWKFLLSVVEAHPGKQVVTKEYMKASRDFWCLLPDVLPDSMMDAKKYAIDEEALVSRTKYKEWIEKLYKEFEGRKINARLDHATEAKCGVSMCSI
jgi:hypothetical protein